MDGGRSCVKTLKNDSFGIHYLHSSSHSSSYLHLLHRLYHLIVILLVVAFIIMLHWKGQAVVDRGFLSNFDFDSHDPAVIRKRTLTTSMTSTKRDELYFYHTVFLCIILTLIFIGDLLLMHLPSISFGRLSPPPPSFALRFANDDSMLYLEMVVLSWGSSFRRAPHPSHKPGGGLHSIIWFAMSPKSKKYRRSLVQEIAKSHFSFIKFVWLAFFATRHSSTLRHWWIINILPTYRLYPAAHHSRLATLSASKTLDFRLVQSTFQSSNLRWSFVVISFCGAEWLY